MLLRFTGTAWIYWSAICTNEVTEISHKLSLLWWTSTGKIKPSAMRFQVTWKLSSSEDTGKPYPLPDLDNSTAVVMYRSVHTQQAEILLHSYLCPLSSPSPPTHCSISVFFHSPLITVNVTNVTCRECYHFKWSETSLGSLWIIRTVAR